MNKEVVGRVADAEKEEILAAFKRKSALLELSKSLGSKTGDQANPLYEKIILDLGDVQIKMDSWWNSMAEKYRWKGTEKGHWEIDFNNNNILLCDNPG